MFGEKQASRPDGAAPTKSAAAVLPPAKKCCLVKQIGPARLPSAFSANGDGGCR
jgi:hypothetical protein